MTEYGGGILFRREDDSLLSVCVTRVKEMTRIEGQFILEKAIRPGAEGVPRSHKEFLAFPTSARTAVER